MSGWRSMTRMAGPDCTVMCNLINTHTKSRKEKVGPVAANPDNRKNNEEPEGSTRYPGLK